MVEFCTCGSLIINDSCTNKNCANKPASKPTTKRAAKAVGVNVVKKVAAPLKTRKSSKCITYNLNDLDNKDKDVY
jgi:hypothetical protein